MGVACRWEWLVGGCGPWVGVAPEWEWLVGGSGLWMGVVHGGSGPGCRTLLFLR